ncbi:hypothetical protein BGP79_02940 [Tersicoccus sp. Bi-70]|nr:hypothetical protein BGP79_02940 [Tersicoccus sp. Bi-70]
MRLSAVVLAGGRGSRLGGVDKASLTLDGRRLLDRVLDAVAGAGVAAGRIAIVGFDDVLPAGPLDRPGRSGNGGPRLVREDPPFGGPAAATAAGLGALATEPDDDADDPDAWVLLLSCDLVHPDDAVEALLPAVRSAAETTDAAVVGVDPDGRHQPLTAAYRRGALAAAVAALTASRGGLTGASMRDLTGELSVMEVPLTSAASADVDTVEDAHRTGVRLPHSPDERARPEEDA